jgi:ATP-dependent Clp protease adaptor protein ClpS
MNSKENETGVKIEQNTNQKIAPRWQVILLDDNEHTYEYVIILAQKIFKRSYDEAFEIAKQVDKNGRAICAVCSKEKAELYQQLVKGFGADPLILFHGKTSTGSMGCVIEPLED